MRAFLSVRRGRGFELRQKGDYMEEEEVTVADVDEMRPLAEEFVYRAESVVQQL